MAQLFEFVGVLEEIDDALEQAPGMAAIGDAVVKGQGQLGGAFAAPGSSLRGSQSGTLRTAPMPRISD